MNVTEKKENENENERIEDRENLIERTTTV